MVGRRTLRDLRGTLKDLREILDDIDSYLKQKTTGEEQALRGMVNQAVGLCRSIERNLEEYHTYYECKSLLPVDKLWGACSELSRIISNPYADVFGTLEELRGIIYEIESRQGEVYRCIFCEDSEDSDKELALSVVQVLLFIMSSITMRLLLSNNIYDSVIFLALVMFMLTLLNARYGIYGVLSMIPGILLGLGVGLISNMIAYILAVIALTIPMAILFMIGISQLIC